MTKGKDAQMNINGQKIESTGLDGQVTIDVTAREEILKGLTVWASEFFKGTLQLLCGLEDQSELNYSKSTVTMENGGKYLISILHIDGPVISLNELRAGGVLDAQMVPNDTKVTGKKNV